MAGILKVDTLQNANASNLVTQTNSTTITIGTTGQTVALASGASSSGFGATYNGAVNWSSTIQTSGFTAVSGTGYFVNTTSGAITVTLPATPTAGDIVAITDYAGTAATNNITVERNGSKIEGGTSNAKINTNRESVTFVYTDSTQGWLPVSDNNETKLVAAYVSATGGTVTTCGNYKIHTFNSSGCFVVSCAGNALGSNSVDYLVVAGGGGGGTVIAGAGGAGGHRSNYPSPVTAGLPVSATTYPIIVGAGGSATPSPSSPTRQPGTSGSNSIFSTITSAGGGGGAGFGGGAPGLSGGSGGGGAGGPSCSPRSIGGTGNTPPVSPSQGNPGGNGPSSNDYGGAGGGGAGAAGGNSPTPGGGGTGGNGTANSITGSPVTRAGGGGGGARACGLGPQTAGSGGSGGGGAGSAPSTTATAGTANTGGGGGGGGFSPGCGNGGAGGSGVVIIRYKYQ